MDPLSILPFELRKRIYSYYFEPDTDPLCTLEIVQGEIRHHEQTKGFAKKLSRTAEELETRTHFGNTAIEVLIEEIQSTASALDAANKADRSADAAAKLRFPEIVRGSDAVRELNKAEKEVGLKLQIRPKESCCHFFNLAHVSRQVHADLFSFCAFGLGGNMETFQPVFSGSNSMCRERVVFLKYNTSPLSQVRQDVGFIKSLPNLRTLYLSCSVPDSLAETADGIILGESSWGEHFKA